MGQDTRRAQSLREIVAKGAMPPLVLAVDDCRAAYDRLRARGVEFTQEPVERGTVDAAFGQWVEDDRGAPLILHCARKRAWGP
jgi:hypothetical protein